MWWKNVENKLDNLRKQIDIIDNELMELFIARMQISEKIAKYKYENHLKITNKSREKEIKSKIQNHQIHVIKHYYEPINKAIMSASKKYQKNLIKSDFR